MAGYAQTLIQSIWEAFNSATMFPYDEGKRYWRSPAKPHMKDIAFQQNPMVQVSPDSWYFEIGNEEAEANAPQYHILENAKIIRRPNRGTKKTRGSQDNIRETRQRDYNAYVLRPRTQSKGDKYGTYELIQEYRQNQSRNFWGTAAKAREYSERVKYHHTNNRNYRENEHWRYMERILNVALPFIADTINAKLVATTSIIDTGELGSTPIYELLNSKNSIYEDLQTGEVIGI